MSSTGFNLSADDHNVGEVLEGSKQIRVPDYQREYSWGKDQWSELWDDVYALTQDRNNHFLGSVVVIEGQGDDIKHLELVDGQQRITTICILLCAIRDRFEEDGEDYDDDVASLIDDILWITSQRTRKEYQKVRLNEYNNPYFRHILEGEADEIEESQVKDAYEYYREKIEEKKLGRLDDVWIELIESISMVQIECSSEVSAFRLFESLNDKGLDLGSVDLVKNRIFMEANQNEDINEDLVKELWEDILSVIRPELSQQYRFFCHYFMSIQEPEATDNVSKRKLYDYVNELLEGRLQEHNMTLEELLEDMHEKSKVYVNIKNGEVKRFRRHTNELNEKVESTQLKNKRIRTLLLRIITEYDDADDVLEALYILEVLNIRNKIAGRDSNTSRDRFWCRACTMLTKQDNQNEYLRRLAEQRSPSDTVLRERMANREFKNNDFTKYVLDRIEEEHYMRSSRGKGVNDRSKVDIEHIAPQSAFTADKYSEWKRYLNCTEEEFEEYKKRIGNLTLLEDRVNQSASDNPFEQKCRIYSHKTEFKMAEAVSDNYDEWSVEKIVERSKELADIVNEIWSMDNV
ncbi:DUF262 domain-containing protein [Natrinema versiforme]|uniref:DUF262 domain-containing protein n=1 Tax=Natrinema versiforme TaxID=88724 RepID=A0A4V1FYF4_9EURY|nr:DUF262 domain-containing protein [Natrinema versiforme]QCS41305.1 DUF262 domain-containing protein [Natrinema versiforme]